MNEDLKKIKQLKDIDFLGSLDGSGRVQQLTGTDADANRLHFWFLMEKGAIIGRPNYGGHFSEVMTKPITGFMTSDIEQKIRLGMAQDFPDFQILVLEVYANMLDGKWEITLEVLNTSQNHSFSLTTELQGRNV